MERENDNKPHKLEDLKRRLFSKTYRNKVEYKDGFSPVSHGKVADSWQNNETVVRLTDKILTKTSLFKKVFVISVAFFILSMGYAAYVFFAGSNTVSNDNIEISITGNNFVAGGEELDLVISVANKNTTSLDLVDLLVEYPKSATQNFSNDTERLRESLGTIPAGAVRNENLKMVLFGEQGSVRPIKVSIEYRVAGSNAIFVKEKMYNVNINSTPINLTVEGPLSVSPNQDITLNIKTSLNATRPAENILVTLDYPLGFKFTKAVPEPSFGDNVWDLGDLAPGAEHGISIYGKMTDVFDGEEKTFNVRSGAQDQTQKSAIDVVFNSARHTIEIKKPFIETAIFINGVGDREFAVDSKTTLNVEIRYANNLSSGVDDVVIEAKIAGNAWDRTGVRSTQGHYDSSKNQITWDSSNKGGLAEISPGDSGSVNFSIDPLSLLSSSGGMLADPTINIEVNIFGRQAAQDSSVNALKNSASAVVRLISDLNFSAKALHFSGAFKNTGPIPPKAEGETTYTIVWTLSNTANSISQAKLSSSLPAWMSFVGPVSPTGEDVSFNSATKEIIWNIGRIARGTGISAASRSVSFQVSLKPSLSQVDTVPAIINGSVLTGRDDFANVNTRTTKGELSARLDSDPAFPPTGGTVVQ
ncbi:MAG: hypothetical protein M3M85_04490 [bacterium]|nr:hypothetical protein [bacterium]